MILVTGAAGGLGRLVVDRLANVHGVPVIAATRFPDRLSVGVPLRRIDFDDPPSLTEGFAGVDTVLLISAGQGEHDVVMGRHGAAIDAAERVGVQHLVYTSLTGAGDHLAMALAHRWTERRLARGRAAWTVLRHGLYAELLVGDTVQAAAAGTLTAPLGDGRLAAVAREDLATVAALVLSSCSTHSGKVYELVGDTAIGGADMAAAASRVAGTTVAYRPGTLTARREALAAAGMPDWRIDHILSIYSAVAAGFLSNTDSDLTRLLGGAPRPALPLITAAAMDGLRDRLSHAASAGR